MFIEAIIPNSFRSLLSVKMNVEKPQAVVKFVIKDAFPIRIITCSRDLDWLPCSLTSC